MIGSKYEETRAMLIEGIRDGTISGIEKVAEQHSCYFCLMPIEGTMM